MNENTNLKDKVSVSFNRNEELQSKNVSDLFVVFAKRHFQDQ